MSGPLSLDSQRYRQEFGFQFEERAVKLCGVHLLWIEVTQGTLDCCRESRSGVLGCRLGHSEISNLCHEVVVEQDVAGLDVSMNDGRVAEGVKILQACTEFQVACN